MRLADLVAPVSSAHGDDGQLSKDDGSPDGGGHFLRALDAKADVAVEVPNRHKSLIEFIIGV